MSKRSNVLKQQGSNSTIFIVLVALSLITTGSSSFGQEQPSIATFSEEQLIYPMGAVGDLEVASCDMTLLGTEAIKGPGLQSNSKFIADAYDGRPAFLVEGQQSGMKIEGPAYYVAPSTTIAWSWKKQAGNVCMIQLGLKNPETGEFRWFGYGAGTLNEPDPATVDLKTEDLTADIFVAKAIPKEWTRIERNLFDDIETVLGWESAQITHFFMSPWDGEPGLFADAVVHRLREDEVPPTKDAKVRFQVLASDLIRMEYSPTGQLVDAPSVTVVKRDWQKVPFKREEKNGWLEIKTTVLTLRYKIGGGRFTKDTLTVTWRDAGGEHVWRPGDKDDKNLGGVPGDYGNRKSHDTNMIFNHPGPLSRNGYFLFDDSHTPIWDKEAEWVEPRPKGGQDQYFFVYGDNYKNILARLAELIGPIPMVPRYIFGAWFGSRAGYSDEQWQMIVERFRESRLPLDVLVIDSGSWTTVGWSGYDVDSEQMPDPRGWFQWMKEHGVKVTVNEHYAPLTRESDRNFETIRQAMGLPVETQEIPHDLSDRKYSELFADLLLKPALDMGMSFWWQDGGSPSSMRGLDPMMWTREVEYHAQERLTGKRTFIFCRYGSWGSHRSGSFFTGDLHGEWPSLHGIIPPTIAGGNMLVAYVNNDTCGVFGAKIDPELYCRWLQFGSLSPTLWLHGIWGLRLPWEYGQDGIETYDKFVGMRYSLIPYFYTYSRIAHETGLPLVRGMYLEYPDQEPAYTHMHQYMLGKEFLVAPITEPARDGFALKEVYLPGGEYWFDYFTGDIYEGGQTISYKCSLETIPLFVRAGSILPIGPKMDYSDQKPVDPLTVDIYAGKAAEFRLYEDDGVSLEYRKGAYSWTPLSFKPTRSEGNYTVTIGPTEGKCEGQLNSRRHTIRLHGLLKPKTVKVEGNTLPTRELGESESGWMWDNKSLVTTIYLSEPARLDRELAITIQNAGTFADAQMLRKVLEYRDRIRKVKQIQKVRIATLIGGGWNRKQARILRETEAVERQLNEMIKEPYGLWQTPPDFSAMTERIIETLANRPFDCTRSLPDLDEESRNTTAKIADAEFPPEEMEQITTILRAVSAR